VSKLPSVIGRFQVLRRLGQGGMAYLFLAWDPMLERQVAIKRLRDDNDELRERFTREARSVARLRHPNIVTIYDVGEQDGEPFIAMEYVVGQTMAEVIQAALPLPITRTLEIISELCDGLGFAHKAGIVHRDVKPANIIVEPEGSIKILDFGIARIAESGMTQAGMLIGTLNYMSPEQVAGLVVDSRSDIFAVGAVFYELLTYRQAFPGGLHNGILNKILSEEPLSLAIACPGLDPEVIRVVERALHKEPEARFQDLASMRKDIARIQQRLESLPPEALAAVSPPPLNENATTKPPGISHALSTSEREDNQRQKDIVEHLDQAYSALARHDFDAALAAARQALQLDPDLREAAEIQERIRLGQETHQVEQWLAAAQELLVAGSLTDAQALADQALTVAPGLPAAVKLREAIDAVRRETEQNRRRAEALKTALARAESLLTSGPLDDAAKAAAEALSLAPEASDARALQRRIQHAIAEREALERRVDQVLRNADSAAAAGRFGDAIAALREFRPEHSRVTAALAQVSEAERLHRDREAVRLREESIATALAAAESLSSHEEAIARLRDAQELDPNHALVRDAIAARERAAAREQEEARLAQERQRLVDAAIDRAKKTSAHDAAIDILEDARRIDPGRDDVRLAMEQRESALAHQREQERLAREREERVAGAVAKAQRTESHEAAIGILHEALKRDSEQAELRQALKGREALLAHQREQERLARERQERIASIIANAKGLASHEAALALLRDAQRIDPNHPELRLVVEQREAALSREQEETRRIRERENKIAGVIAKAERTGHHEAAIAILNEAVALDPDNAEAKRLIEVRRAAMAEEQRQARERAEKIAVAIARANETASHETAIATLQRAKELDPQHRELRQALEARQAALQAERAEKRRIEEQRQVIAAGMAKARQTTSNQAALAILQELARLDPDHAEIRDLMQARLTALEQEQEAAHQARLRQEQITALVAEAKASRSHADAVAALTRALDLDSSDQRVRALLETRTAAAERERAAAARQQSIQDARARIGALIEKRNFDSAQSALDDAERTHEAKREMKDVRRALARERKATAGPQPVSSRQAWTRLGIAAAVVLSVGLGYWALRTPGPAPTPLEPGADTQATSPAAPSPGPAETARPDPNTPVPPAASDVPIAGGPAPEAPVVEAPAIPPVVPETIQRARQQMAQGNLPQAAVIVMEGLKTQASDRQLRALAVEIVAEARAQALKARGAADERGDVAMNTPPYRDASRRIVDAGRLERAGRYDQATRSLSEAQGLFSRAAQAAQPPQVAQTPRPTPPTEPAVPPSTVTQSPALPPPAAAPPPPAAAPPTTAAAPPTVPTSQPPAAATTPTPSAAAQAAADEEGVRSALRAYEQAYSSLKVEAVLEVYPDVNAAQLKRSFDDLREQQVSIACDQIAVSGVNANATCQVRTSILPRAGSRRTQMIRSLFRLQKVGNRWIIVERRGA